MVMTTIAATLGGVKTSFDLLKIAVDLRDNHKVSLALQEIQDKLLSVTIAATDVAEKSTTLVQELASARQEIAELLNRLAKAQKQASKNAEYELTELTLDSWAYVHKPSLENAKRPHYLCSACFKKGNHAILQGLSKGGVIYLHCPVCEYEYDTGRRYPNPPLQF